MKYFLMNLGISLGVSIIISFLSITVYHFNFQINNNKIIKPQPYSVGIGNGGDANDGNGGDGGNVNIGGGASL